MPLASSRTGSFFELTLRAVPALAVLGDSSGTCRKFGIPTARMPITDGIPIVPACRKFAPPQLTLAIRKSCRTCHAFARVFKNTFPQSGLYCRAHPECRNTFNGITHGLAGG